MPPSGDDDDARDPEPVAVPAVPARWTSVVTPPPPSRAPGAADALSGARVPPRTTPRGSPVTPEERRSLDVLETLAERARGEMATLRRELENERERVRAYAADLERVKAGAEARLGAEAIRAAAAVQNAAKSLEASEAKRRSLEADASDAERVADALRKERDDAREECARLRARLKESSERTHNKGGQESSEGTLKEGAEESSERTREGAPEESSARRALPPPPPPALRFDRPGLPLDLDLDALLAAARHEGRVKAEAEARVRVAAAEARADEAMRIAEEAMRNAADTARVRDRERAAAAAERAATTAAKREEEAEKAAPSEREGRRIISGGGKGVGGLFGEGSGGGGSGGGKGFRAFGFEPSSSVLEASAAAEDSSASAFVSATPRRAAGAGSRLRDAAERRARRPAPHSAPPKAKVAPGTAAFARPTVLDSPSSRARATNAERRGEFASASASAAAAPPSAPRFFSARAAAFPRARSCAACEARRADAGGGLAAELRACAVCDAPRSPLRSPLRAPLRTPRSPGRGGGANGADVGRSDVRRLERGYEETEARVSALEARAAAREEADAAREEEETSPATARRAKWGRERRALSEKLDDAEARIARLVGARARGEVGGREGEPTRGRADAARKTTRGEAENEPPGGR